MLDAWMTVWHWTNWLAKNLPGFALTEGFTYQKQRLDLWFEREDEVLQLAWLPHQNQFTFYLPRTPSRLRRRVEIFKTVLSDNGAIKGIDLHPDQPVVRFEVENDHEIIFDFRHPRGNVYLRKDGLVRLQFLKAVPWRPVPESWMGPADLKRAMLGGKIAPTPMKALQNLSLSEQFDSLEWLARHYRLAGTGNQTNPIPEIVRDILHQDRHAQAPAQTEPVRKRGKTVLTRWQRKFAKLATELEGNDITLLQNQADGLAIAIASHLSATDSDRLQLPAHLSPTGEALVIPLNPKLGLQANLEKLYQQVRKLKARVESHKNRLQATQAEITALETHLAAGDEVALKQFLEQHGERFSRERSSQPERVPYRKFTSPSGYPILVGRSARDNDTVTFKLSGKFDWWFHARGVTGSHVILQTGKQTPQHSDLIMAAQLAARFSDAKHAGVVPVSFCQRKYLSRPKGGAPGAVKLIKEEVLTVEPYDLTGQ